VIVELGGGRVLGLEIKAAAAPGDADTVHLRWLREELGDRMVAGVIMHTGPRLYVRSEGIIAAPIATLSYARDGCGGCRAGLLPHSHRPTRILVGRC
jgi:hypothetical protein